MTGIEISQTYNFQMTKSMKTFTKDPANHTFVMVHMCFNVKFYFNMKGILIAGEGARGGGEKIQRQILLFWGGQY